MYPKRMKTFLFVTLLCSTDVLLPYVAGNPRTPKTLGRLHFPVMGFGPWCRGCPSHFCDDDPAVVHGYCCGCAQIYDNLPIRCSSFLKCPLNTFELCEKYEYMMYCCC